MVLDVKIQSPDNNKNTYTVSLVIVFLNLEPSIYLRHKLAWVLKIRKRVALTVNYSLVRRHKKRYF